MPARPKKARAARLRLDLLADLLADAHLADLPSKRSAVLAVELVRLARALAAELRCPTPDVPPGRGRAVVPWRQLGRAAKRKSPR